MRYYALACDFDGTIAWNGQVDQSTMVALRRVREHGRKLLLVTGRELEDLIDIFPGLDLFDRVVAENGAIVYCPETDDLRLLGDPPSPDFIRDLKLRGVAPLSVGEVIVATWHPHEAEVLNIIEKHGLDHHVIFNKGAVMVMPAGIDKGTGLAEALQELWLSPRNCICIGDAENDRSMFRVCELAVAVDNALTTVKESADLVTQGHHGAGVVEAIDRLLSTEMNANLQQPERHSVLLGRTEESEPVYLPSFDSQVLVAGASGSGKSMLATGVLEQLLRLGYQVCVIDPEGDYSTVPNLIPVGSSQWVPTVSEVAQILEHPARSVVINLLGMPFDQRPAFLTQLCPDLRDLHIRTGRPHWIIIDEAHHLLPKWVEPICRDLSGTLPSLLLVTVDPRHLLPAELRAVTHLIAVGPQPDELLRSFAKASGRPELELSPTSRSASEALLWHIDANTGPVRYQARPCQSIHRRHRRKYAEGDMGPDRSFYFRGPGNRHNLPARNLIEFIDNAQSLEDETWLYHARRSDYSNWVRGAIGDRELADEIACIESQQELPAAESYRLIRLAIEERYTLPV